MKRLFRLSGMLLLIALLPSAVLATKFVTYGEPGFSADTIYDDDVFITGNKIKIDGRVEGDLFAFSQEIVHSGNINGSFNSFAESIQVLGSVGKSFRAFGNKVSCNAPIGKNLMVFGNKVDIGPQTTIGKNGDLFCAKLVFKGDVKGDLTIVSDNTVISGRIGGDLEFEGSTLIIGPDAIIEGGISYKSPNKAEIDGSAQIGGEVDWEEVEEETDDDQSGSHFLGLMAWFFSFKGYLMLVMMVSLMVLIFTVIPFPVWGSILFYAIIMLVSGNVLLLLTKQKAKETVSLLNARFFPSLGLGFAIFFVGPLVSLVIIFTFIGAPLGITMLLLFGAAAFAGSVYACAYFGKIVLGLLGGNAESEPGNLHYSLGVLLVILLSFIPFLGYFLITVVFMTGLGGLAQSFKLK